VNDAADSHIGNLLNAYWIWQSGVNKANENQCEFAPAVSSSNGMNRRPPAGLLWTIHGGKIQQRDRISLGAHINYVNL